jgi:hypothetical protein
MTLSAVPLFTDDTLDRSSYQIYGYYSERC